MKTVTLTLDPMSFVVDGTTDNELIENAKKAMVEQLQKQFPHLTYRLSDADVLNESDAKPGTIIVDSDGKLGIISSVNSKNRYPITYTLSKGITMKAVYTCLKLSPASFEDARYRRPDYDKDTWYEGHTGYIKVKDVIHEVVVGKKEKGKRLLHIINKKGEGFLLAESQITAFLKDEKSEIK